jgi:hypothetical protein
MSREQMQLLLDSLGATGLFDAARPDPLPGAAGVLSVTIDGRTIHWSRVASTPLDEVQRYNISLQNFLNIYNQTPSFHASTGSNSVYEEHRQNVLRYRQEQRDAASGELNVGGGDR